MELASFSEYPKGSSWRLDRATPFRRSLANTRMDRRDQLCFRRSRTQPITDLTQHRFCTRRACFGSTASRPIGRQCTLAKDTDVHYPLIPLNGDGTGWIHRRIRDWPLRPMIFASEILESLL